MSDLPRFHGPESDAPPDSGSSDATLVHRDGIDTSVVLERGLESQGSPPMTFDANKPLGPISVGRAGDFRLDGRGVLTIHAYLMWDGVSLHLSSADEANPVVVEGARVPRDWTRLAAPCTLVFGRTQMVLRAAAGDSTAPSGLQRPTFDIENTQKSAGPGARPMSVVVPTSENTLLLPSAQREIRAASEGGRQSPMRAPSISDNDQTQRPVITLPLDNESTLVQPERAPMQSPMAEAWARPPDIRPAAGDYRPPVVDARPPMVDLRPSANEVRLPQGDNESTRVHREPWQAPEPIDTRAGNVQPMARPAAGVPAATGSQPRDLYPPTSEGEPTPLAGAVRKVEVITSPSARSAGSPGDASPTLGAATNFPGFVQAPTASPSAPAGKGSPLTDQVAAISQRSALKLRKALSPGAKTRIPILMAACVFSAVLVGGTTVAVRLRGGGGGAVATQTGKPTGTGATTVPPSSAQPATTGAPVTPTPTTAGIVLYPAPVRKMIDGGILIATSDNPRKPIIGDAGPPSVERAAIDAINRGDLNAALTAYRQLAHDQPNNPAFANAVRLIQQKLGGAGGPGQ